MANIGNPLLCSGVIAGPRGPKPHTFSVILAVFAPQPRWRHKPWKGLLIYKRINACLIHPKADQECYWIANSVIKMLINSVCTFTKNVCQLSVRAVFTWLSKGIGFGFGFTTPFGWLVYLLWFWFYDSQVKTALLNIDYNAKIIIESDLCANIRFSALMNVSSRCWSPFHANECVFSLNEQQKV